MNQMTTNERVMQETSLILLGNLLVGQTAQSRILTEIGTNGNRVFQKPQVITGYEIVESFGEPTLMVIIGGNSVYESTLFNIQPIKNK